MSKPAFPLAGVRVLDLSRALSGPYAGRLLSDLGAEVVKVEVPDTEISQPPCKPPGVAWAEIRTPATVLDSPTATVREVAAQVDDRDGGTRPVIRMPYRFSAASCEPRGGAAHLGEHNHDVLGRWLGRNAEAVEELELSGALHSGRSASADAG